MRVLETAHLCKEYPGTLALDDISVGFQGGQVHALIGKNGAGKSTLVKILAGSEQPTGGTIRMGGEEIELPSPSQAFQRGIATVYQELSLVPGLSVAENILLGRLPRRGLGGRLIDWPAAFARAEEVLATMQVEIDVRQPVGLLGVAQQQIVEIAKAMSFDPAVLMLDEPTSALARHETQSLFTLIRQLAARNVAIVYISHRLQELREIADCVTVLRDGRHIGTVEMSQTTSAAIVRMMFGETVQLERPGDLRAGERVVMSVRGLARQDHFWDISFDLHEGELLGIAGMLGSGRTELLKSIFGAEPFDAGELIIEGQRVQTATPAIMRELGLAFTPENRKEEALMLWASTRANMCMAGMKRLARRGFVARQREEEVVVEQAERLHIKMGDSQEPVASLSGGNQQKVVVGNWLATHPQVILFDEPTRGIDVQAKQQIFEVMWELSRQGISSIFVSTELEELLEVCHRVLIIKNGRLAGEIQPEEVAADALYVMCMEE